MITMELPESIDKRGKEKAPANVMSLKDTKAASFHLAGNKGTETTHDLYLVVTGAEESCQANSQTTVPTVFTDAWHLSFPTLSNLQNCS